MWGGVFFVFNKGQKNFLPAALFIIYRFFILVFDLKAHFFKVIFLNTLLPLLFFPRVPPFVFSYGVKKISAPVGAEILSFFIQKTYQFLKRFLIKTLIFAKKFWPAALFRLL